MKTLFIILLLTIVSFHSIAQSQFKNTFGLAGGITLFGTGDIKGYNFAPKYERQLNKLIAFQGQLNFAYAQRYSNISAWNAGNNPYTMTYLQSSSQKLHLGLLIGVIRQKSHFLGLNASAGVVRYTQFRYGGFSLSPSSNFPDDITYISTPPFYQKNITAGLGAGIEYRFSMSKHLGVGIEGAYQQYGGHSESRVNLGLYYSFNGL